MPLRGQALASNLFHLFAETIELAERGVDVGGNANSLEFVVHDGHGEDVVFVEQIFRNGFGIRAVDVNICYCARLTGSNEVLNRILGTSLSRFIQ